ncbi:MAG: SH3 domain-containing protein [Deltaproteobacteria bacterium]
MKKSVIMVLMLLFSIGGYEKSGYSAEILYVIFPVALREQPNINSESLEDLNVGDKLTVIVFKDSWYKARTESGKSGYVAESWITKNAGQAEKAKAEEPKRLETEKKADTQREAIIKKIESKPGFQKIKNSEVPVELEKIKIGMSMQQCKNAWGEPRNVSNTTTATGTDTHWCYENYCSKSLFFKNGILVLIRD